MRTWSELRSDIRYQLKDTGSNPKWSDEELRVYANYALADYSHHFPLEKAEAVTLTGTGSAVISSDWEVFAVEYPEDVFLDQISIKPGTRLWSSSVGWYLLEGKLWVAHPDEPSEVTVHYRTSHPRITNDGDVIDVPAVDEELIALFVLAKCTERVGEQSANLDRWKDGRRDDNPLIPMQNHYYVRYRQGISERLGGRAIRVKYTRRRHGDLRSRLYG